MSTHNLLLPSEDNFLFDLTPIILGSERIKNATNWQDKYRQLMLIGKYLPELTTEFQQQNALVKGCESQAWLYHHQINNKHYFIANSDSRIVQGLIALIFNKVQGKANLENFSLQQYFIEMGLDNQLSPSRTNGTIELVNRMLQLSQLSQ